MIELPPFCEAFQTTPRRDRDGYVAGELRRIRQEGHSVLATVIGCADDDAQACATRLLHDNLDPEGGEILEALPWRLRLVKDAVPPNTDPQGRRLPKEKQGNTLVVKVGNKGGRLRDNAEAEQVRAFSGPQRTVNVRAGRDLYETVEVTRDPKVFTLRNAILILRRWGHGVTYERARMEPDRDGNLVEVQCNWLVEEVLDAPAATPEPTKKRA